MKILIVSEFSVPYCIGGGEIRYGEIAKRLVKAGNNVTWLHMKQAKAPKKEVIDGVKHISKGPRIRKPPKRGILSMIRFSFSVFFHLLKNKYDIVDCQTYIPLLPTYLATRLTKTKMVATIHDVSSRKKDQWMKGFGFLGSFFEGIFYKRKYDTIITVSPSVKNRLVKEWGVSPKRINVVYNGVDYEFIKNIKAGKKTNDLIFVGRLIPHKHVDDFLEVINRLKKKNEKIKAIIIGTGEEEKRLKEIAKEREIENNVKFLGKLKSYTDVIKKIKETKVLVLPSTREGFGIVLAEAMASEVPVAAYRTAGVIDVVEDKKTGYFAKERNINELVKYVDELLSNDKKRKCMGKEGRKRVKKYFTWDKTAKGTIKVYKCQKEVKNE